MMPRGVFVQGAGEKWVLLEYYVIDTPTPCRYHRQAGKNEAFLAMKVPVKAKKKKKKCTASF